MAKKEEPAGTPPEAEKAEGEVAESTFTKEDYERLQKDKVGLEQRISEQADRLKKLENRPDLKAEFDTLKEEMRMGFGMLGEGRSLEDENNPQGAWQKRYEQMRAQEEAKRVSQQLQKRVEALGLSPNDKTYRQIYRDVRNGDFDIAEREIAELETEKEVKSKPPEIDTEKTKADLLKEVEAEFVAKHPEWFKTETGGPSAASRNFAQVAQDFSEGKVSLEEYSRARKAEGLD